jgi:hypothetical protein
MWGMDTDVLQQRIQAISSKRKFLLDLLEEPNIGSLRVDVDQALEELDDLIAEFKQVFPEVH